MALINVQTLKQDLALEGVEYELSDEQLGLLLTNVVNELIGVTKAPITPSAHKTIIRDYCDDMIELDYYPIKNITSLQIGSRTLTGNDYTIDDNLGIIYFHTKWSGMLVCEYTCQLGNDVIGNMVNPLVFDIIKYRLTTNFSGTGVMSNVKEGDVSVNYDTSTSLGSLIQGRINDLKSMYSIRVKVI